MISKTAMEDLKALRAGGYKPTDEEVIRLNDIGVRIEKGKDTTPANMPRVAFAGNVVLHEPTVGSVQWWLDYGRDAAYSDRGRLATYFFMLANAVDLDALFKLRLGDDIMKAVAEWTRKCTATDEELWRAMMWVKFGSEDAADLLKDDGPKCSLDDDELEDSLWMQIIAAAGACGTPIESLRTRTRSELIGTLVQANLRARIPMKQSVAKDYMAYRRILRQIEDRGNG